MLSLYIFVLFTNIFFLFGSTENSKKESSIRIRLLVYFHFGMNESLFVFMLLSMHLLNFMLWVYVLCFSVWGNYMTRFYYYTISRKEVPRKFWLDPRFPRNPKLKWILKWLSLYRGYFKVYFFKRGKFSNNLVPYISLNS